jgi:hypothetical protein
MINKTAVRILLILSFIIPFIMSFPLWLSKRSFPVIPLFFEGLEFNYSIDIAFLIIFGLFSIWFLIKSKGSGGLFFFMAYVGFCILDQTRIQPFFFEISILILFYYLFRNDFSNFKIAFLILMSGTYIWSGLHKINPTFFEFWLGGLNKRIPIIPLSLRQVITFFIPFLEMSFGVALLFNKTRKLGIYLLAVMHSMVVITLLIGKISFMVVPLNVVNVLLLFMLCYNLNWNVLSLKLSSLKLKFITIYALLLPSLNLIGFYDHLLSFSYFSGKPNYCNLVFSNKSDLDHLSQEIAATVRTYEGMYYINVNEWSVKYVNVMCYPEKRVYMYLKNYIETFTGSDTITIQYYKK